IEKALDCVFANEVGFDINLRRSLADRLFATVSKTKCPKIFHLEGGPLEKTIDLDIWSEDIRDNKNGFDQNISISLIQEVVGRNGFQIASEMKSGDCPHRFALFFVSSFFNHSCIPNAIRYTIGDTIFVRSATDIAAGEEIFISYTEVIRPYKERRKA